MVKVNRTLIAGMAIVLGLASCARQDSPDNSGAESAEAISPEQAVDACEAELELARQASRPGDTVGAVLRLSLPSGWHTYANPPGDSGMPPSLSLQTASGQELEIGDFEFPPPETFKDSAGVTYGYEDSVELPFEFTVPDTADNGSLALKGTVHWLICRDICLPVETTVDGRLDIDTNP